MPYYLGIDGGATRTTAWVADQRGVALARAEAGPSNPLKVGFEAAQREILRAARKALGATRRVTLTKARTGGRDQEAIVLEAVCAGLAGVGAPPVHRRLYSWLRKAIPARRHMLTTDAAIVLRAAVGGEPGVVVNAGTGSFAYGQDGRGQTARAGGWGIPFDDRGSGYDLGRKAIGAALRDFDGRGAPTVLTRTICRALHLKNIPQVVLKALTQQQIAALFPLVVQAARRKDKVARILCQQAGRELADLVIAVIERFGWRRRAFPVVCTGGVLKSSAMIRRVFARRVHSHAPRLKIRLLRRTPVEGALDLARALASAVPTN
jgi:N-acetylglucosamine kinase-like BadF-type ATPase